VNRSGHYLFALVMLCCISAVASAQMTPPATQPVPPAVGEKLRDFTLKRLDGKAMTLSELNKSGPVVVIMLRGWVGYQCPICTQQVAGFFGKANEFRAAGANVVMIYPGSADLVQGKAEEFVTGKTIPEGFHFVIDPDLKTVNQYALRWNALNETAYPSTFVVGRDGIVKFAKISHSHGDRSTAPEVLELLKSDHPATMPAH
jgi:peroxiredoxin